MRAKPRARRTYERGAFACGSYADGRGRYQGVYDRAMAARAGTPLAAYKRVLRAFATVLAACAPDAKYNHLFTPARRADVLRVEKFVGDPRYRAMLRDVLPGHPLAVFYADLARAVRDDDRTFMNLTNKANGRVFHDCAVDWVCHAAYAQMAAAAVAVQKAWRTSRYDPEGALFKRWAADVARRHGMAA